MNDGFMQRAIDLSERSVDEGGGPFGAVVVKDGEVVAEGTNRVTLDNDPTAHAEVRAIRKACEILGTFDLGDCEIYASCEPCPMCLGAIYWSRIRRVYYANTREDAARIRFSDEDIYDEFSRPLAERRIVSLVRISSARARDAFERWIRKSDRTPY
ncbi:nucleoside deaminase [Candidatus Palauibacter soopunensis]|uniref:nucleoside deaminase n=1 Tax=Candidatus Palauibacter soopunensis TaxID=3056739 RepID=UPI0023943748|nr:nucleoside deaminase [Candidatus Palauibacter soopunensis]MDE2879302.1 nucleoside deaminase [Candidatus Palauibacter soopunensis]